MGSLIYVWQFNICSIHHYRSCRSFWMGAIILIPTKLHGKVRSPATDQAVSKHELEIHRLPPVLQTLQFGIKNSIWLCLEMRDISKLATCIGKMVIHREILGYCLFRQIHLLRVVRVCLLCICDPENPRTDERETKWFEKAFPAVISSHACPSHPEKTPENTSELNTPHFSFPVRLRPECLGNPVVHFFYLDVPGVWRGEWLEISTENGNGREEWTTQQ